MAGTQEMNIPEVHTFEHLRSLAKENAASGRKPRAALVVSSSTDMLKAFDRAAADGLIDPVIVGDEQRFQKHATELGLKLTAADVIDINQPPSAVKTAAQMAAKGDVDLLVRGGAGAVEMLHLLFEKEAGFVVKGKTVSHLAVIKPERYGKLLILTDSGVIPQPDLKQKMALIGNASGFCRTIGITPPRVALLAAVEVVYPQMQATTEGAILSKMAERNQIKGAYVDGPLSFDVAVDMFAAHSKGIKDSEVAGQADVMVAPNIETAYGVYTAMAMYGPAEVGGILVGGRVPVAFSSHFESVEGKYNSIALAALAAMG